MSEEFRERVKNLSTEKLIKILTNYSDYQTDYVNSAEKELATRGIQLTPDEKREIENKKKEDKEDIEDDAKYRKFIMGGWHEYVVNDESAPELFSLSQILFCSALFTALTGGILLVYNLLKLKNRKPIIIVLALSLILSAGYVSALYFYFDLNSVESKHTSRLIIGGNFFVSYGLFTTLWWNYIGNKVRYRSKSFIIPAILGIVLITLIYLGIKL